MKGQKGIETPVIFLTARSNSEDMEKGIGLGAADYITKPTKKEILLSKVKSVLEKKENNKESLH
jgi:DNA-binding response OmpR family regulator